MVTSAFSCTSLGHVVCEDVIRDPRGRECSLAHSTALTATRSVCERGDKYLPASLARQVAKGPYIIPFPVAMLLECPLTSRGQTCGPNRPKWAKKIVLEGLEQRGRRFRKMAVAGLACPEAGLFLYFFVDNIFNCPVLKKMHNLLPQR